MNDELDDERNFARGTTLYDALMENERFERMGAAIIGDPLRGHNPHIEFFRKAAIEAALRSQSHFICDIRGYNELAHNLEQTTSYQRLMQDFKALEGVLNLPSPTCWFEVHWPNKFKLGFAMRQSYEPWTLTLYTFQQMPTGFNPLAIPRAMPIETTLRLDNGGEIIINGADFLGSPEEINTAKINLYSVIKLALIVSKDFKGTQLVNAAGESIFAQSTIPEADMSQVVERNLNGFNVFHLLDGDWGEAVRSDFRPRFNTPEPPV